MPRPASKGLGSGEFWVGAVAIEVSAASDPEVGDPISEDGTAIAVDENFGLIAAAVAFDAALVVLDVFAALVFAPPVESKGLPCLRSRPTARGTGLVSMSISSIP